jgi:hypothetical protein
MHFDALWLREEISVLEPMADFSRLPYQTSGHGYHDVNANAAYLSEEILSHPFQDRRLTLKRGVHLHWALPDALTRGISQGILFDMDLDCSPGTNGELPKGLRDEFAKQGVSFSNAARAASASGSAGGHWIILDPYTERTFTLRAGDGRLNVYGSAITFPAVPNRWLIRRYEGDTKTAEWIVESDYLHDPAVGAHDADRPGQPNAAGASNPPPTAVTFPFHDDTHPPPFRYVGRQLVRDAWEAEQTSETGAKHLEKLTAIGHGDPNFHAFYPNCHSVFGCFDPAPPEGEIHYDVLGWFADPSQDPLQSLTFREARSAIVAKYNLPEVTPEANYETVAEFYGWRVAQENGSLAERDDWWRDLDPAAAYSPFPERTVCYARTRLDSNRFNFQDATPSGPQQPVRVAVGNTGTEALSAYLADRLEVDKVKVEDQLEALHLAGHFKGRHLDIGATFKRARHTKQYTAVNAGLIWTVAPKGARAQVGPSSKAESPPARPTLATDVAHLLNQLNLTQAALDQCGHEIISRRRQLFADWYKYMICAYPQEDQIGDYPDMDEVRFFIETNGLRPLDQQVAYRQTLKDQRDQLLGQLSQRLVKISTEPPTDGPPYILKPIPAPRFWRPNDPVILIDGVKPTPRHGEDGALKCRLKSLASDEIAEHFDDLMKAVEEYATGKTTGLHHKREQPWHPFLLEWRVDVAPLGDGINLAPDDPAYNTDFITRNYTFPDAGDDLKLKSHQAHVIGASNRYSGRSILLPHAKTALRTQMEAYLQTRLLPAYYKAEEIPAARRTDDFFVNNYEKIFAWYKAGYWLFREGDFQDPTSLAVKLRDASVLLSQFLREQFEQPPKDLLSTAPSEKLQDALIKELNQLLTRGSSLYDQTRFADVTLSEETERLRSQNPQGEDLIRLNRLLLEDAYPQEIAKKDKNLTSLLKIYQKLFDNPKQPKDSPDLHCMTQTLTGFNEALLMHKQTRQLPIDDPLGFESNRAFTSAVREAVQSETRSAPQPLNDFNPLRSGVLRLVDLRLVDTFGRVQDLNLSAQPVVKAEPLQTKEFPREIHLPPRFTQPARLNFRWLSADRTFTEHTDEPEMNSHPVSSPLCGWLLPNLFDRRLMVYAADGRPLGSISTDRQWYGAPGEPRLAPWEVPNPHLGRLLVHLLRHENLESFLNNIETHYGAIDPENFAEHAALSLLIGRPLAVARAVMNLELQGLPAVNEDWNSFRRDLHRSAQSTDGIVERREDDDFAKVKIPIKLGAFEQLNDGLVAFWEEHWAVDGVCKYRYVEHDQDRKYVQYSADADPLCHALDDSPVKLTLLLDPRGVVHATSGILPAKAISIPPDQYADALKRLAVTFLTAPVLTETGKINLPLPEEPGYVWCWVDKAHGTWEDVEDIGRPKTNATWGAAQEVVEGWLKLTPSTEE